MGIFACVDFELGNYIHTVRYEREITETNPLNSELGERYEHCAYPDGKVMLVAAPDRYMNHSCDPNAYYRYDGSMAMAYARRAIAKGSEITVDYLNNNPGGDSWLCRCGSERCRGKTGTSFFKLPLPFQREYYPLLADWFKARFPGEVAELERQL
ncbi:MAG: SET domain-containing protein-lysine N-methyltransferase [bacterium]